MNSGEIKVDEEACAETISSLKAASDSADEAYSLVSRSNLHIEDGLRGNVVIPITDEYNKIVKEIKKIEDDIDQDTSAVNKIVSSFEIEDKKLAQSSIRR
ncbi:hypothetical protein [Clostridium felsineum]|uniref:Uncharacterized protein n=1 Tax=Clostridium felsineum TaxID=36839 RepID=A0A1S8KYZ7_9CLOT|nr:hypothetical protein [Clostridium felsineum]MCR3760836.1 hypothetical protein [Clostridium felsineum]URZ07795.1 hypothetical protein CLROS_031560 [Clostridium felsineum]URZ12826.1 hypothetical protein CROST_035710 [Clostridium felsineum]URZ15211.1 hypothetical protein CLFE_012290 [Clostridium felsineum DSM 794]